MGGQGSGFKRYGCPKVCRYLPTYSIFLFGTKQQFRNLRERLGLYQSALSRLISSSEETPVFCSRNKCLDMPMSGWKRKTHTQAEKFLQPNLAHSRNCCPLQGESITTSKKSDFFWQTRKHLAKRSHNSPHPGKP